MLHSTSPHTEKDFIRQETIYSSINRLLQEIASFASEMVVSAQIFQKDRI